ncbi:uncharacterized protein [Diabrotica undecimpunctata]|uniref:uncharacterized protein n=1 Tax=Diabrotica undecimpunctata TaxID=50387 RepID=UPI003B640CFB
MKDETAERPKVPYGSNTPNQGSNWNGFEAEGAKITRKKSGYYKERQIHLTIYNVRTVISYQKIMELEKELKTLNGISLASVKSDEKEKPKFLLNQDIFHFRGEEDTSNGGVRFIIRRKHKQSIVES